MRMLCLVLGVFAVSGASASLAHTESFKSHLTQLQTSGTTLEHCLVKVTHPLSETSRFANDVKTIEDLIHKLEGRISSTVDIMDAILVIPYVGAFASPVIAPTTTVLNTINNGLKKVTNEIDSVVKVIRGWLAPLQTVQNDVKILNSKITQVLSVIGKVKTETAKVETCVMKLPAGSPKTHAEAALEKVTSAVDHVPTALLSPVSHVSHGCSEVESFLHKLHVVRRKRSLPSLSKVISVLKHIDDAFGPLGHFLDEVHHALDKKICLLGEIIKIGKEVVHGIEHVGKEVVEGAEHVGKEVVKGTEHVVHEVGHVASSIGHAFHHIFGRRAIDGRYYVIVDKDFNSRGTRGLDICVSIHDALKVVNGVTGGMLSEAQKFIGKLFHGKLPFKIPGLTSDFFHLTSFLKPFHIPMPNFSSVLKIAESQLVAALHLQTAQQYIAAVPACKAAITG